MRLSRLVVLVSLFVITAGLFKKFDLTFINTGKV